MPSLISGGRASPGGLPVAASPFPLPLEEEDEEEDEDEREEEEEWEGVPDATRTQSAMHRKREARKDASVSFRAASMSWWKMAEVIWGVRVPACLPQTRSIGITLHDNKGTNISLRLSYRHIVYVEKRKGGKRLT